MNLQIAINIAVGVLMPLVIFALGYIVAIGKDLAAYKVHVAENYVQKPEMGKFEKTMSDMQTTLQDILRTVHELKGRMEQK